MPADEHVIYEVGGSVQKADSDQKCEGNKIGWGSGLSRLK